MQPIPPLYFPFCLHSFLHPFTSSLSIFHAHTAPYTELFTLTDTAYILLSLKIPVVIHPHFLLPVCLYSSIHPAGFYSVPFVLISFREDNSACFSFTSLCSQHELLGAWGRSYGAQEENCGENKISLEHMFCCSLQSCSCLWGVLWGGGVLPSRMSSHLQGREVEGSQPCYADVLWLEFCCLGIDAETHCSAGPSQPALAGCLWKTLTGYNTISPLSFLPALS